ncbi:hypothetical protein EV360DRAFT_76968, partial [Lentinula raphanica]
MIVLSHSKIVTLLVLAGMISVLALPVQDGTIHSPSSSTGKDVQDKNSKPLEVPEETNKGDLQLPPLQVWQAGAEGDLELKYQRRDVYAYGKERTFKEKIKDIQKRISWAQKIGPYRDGRRRKFMLLSDRLMKTSEGSKVDNEDKKLLNIYDILLPPPGID